MRDLLQPELIYGGIGYRESYSYTPGIVLTDLYTYSGAFAAAFTSGLGRKSVSLNYHASAPGQVVIGPIPGTGIDVLYLKGQSGSSTFEWRINAGSWTSVSAVNGSVLAGGKLSIGAAQGLVPGDTVTIKHTGGSGTHTMFEGAMFYDQDEANGFRFWNASASLGQPEDFLDNTAYQAYAVVDPDLVIIDLGANAFTGGSSVSLSPTPPHTDYVNTPAQMKADLHTLVAAIRAKCTKPPSMLYLVKPMLPAVGGVTNPDTFDEYRTAMFEFVQEDGTMAVLDMGDLFADFFTGTDTWNITADDYHPDAEGYTVMAQAVTQFVASQIGPRPDPRPRIIPSTTTLHSTQIAKMPSGAQTVKYTP
jgi:lysophospholipase L1-like esterase